MKTKVEELVGLIDDALGIAEERLQTRRANERSLPALEAVVAALRNYREQALSGTLPPSEGHATLGLSRFVLDWDELDSTLVKAVGKADRFYQENF